MEDPSSLSQGDMSEKDRADSQRMQDIEDILAKVEKSKQRLNRIARRKERIAADYSEAGGNLSVISEKSENPSVSTSASASASNHYDNNVKPSGIPRLGGAGAGAGGFSSIRSASSRGSTSSAKSSLNGRKSTSERPSAALLRRGGSSGSVGGGDSGTDDLSDMDFTVPLVISASFSNISMSPLVSPSGSPRPYSDVLDEFSSPSVSATSSMRLKKEAWYDSGANPDLSSMGHSRLHAERSKTLGDAYEKKSEFHAMTRAELEQELRSAKREVVELRSDFDTAWMKDVEEPGAGKWASVGEDQGRVEGLEEHLRTVIEDGKKEVSCLYCLIVLYGSK